MPGPWPADSANFTRIFAFDASQSLMSPQPPRSAPCRFSRRLTRCAIDASPARPIWICWAANSALTERPSGLAAQFLHLTPPLVRSQTKEFLDGPIRVGPITALAGHLGQDIVDMLVDGLLHPLRQGRLGMVITDLGGGLGTLAQLPDPPGPRQAGRAFRSLAFKPPPSKMSEPSAIGYDGRQMNGMRVAL